MIATSVRDYAVNIISLPPKPLQVFLHLFFKIPKHYLCFSLFLFCSFSASVTDLLLHGRLFTPAFGFRNAFDLTAQELRDREPAPNHAVSPAVSFIHLLYVILVVFHLFVHMKCLFVVIVCVIVVILCLFQ